MNSINKEYGDFVIQNLIGFEIVLCGTLTFKGRSKDIDELNWRMNRFREERLVKYKITSTCYWVIEKMGNEDNHIHLMIGVRKDHYKGVDDYCNIFAGYWKNFGSCLFVEYDNEKGLFGDYIFKNLVEWDFFETEFVNVKNDMLFSVNKQNITMTKTKFNPMEFLVYIENDIKKIESKSVKDSLIAYINKELDIIENDYKGDDLILSNTGKNGNIRKDIRCWGDVNKNGIRRISYKCKNEKVYFSIEDAKNGKVYGLSDISKQSVIDNLTLFRDNYSMMNNSDIELWYVKKDKINNTKNIISIHDK